MSNEIALYQMSDMERMARAFAASKLFGVQTPEQALALCLIAQAEGRHPASAANDYHIISGRPSKKAEAMLRDFLSAGGKVEWHVLDDEQGDATFSHPSGGTVRIQWDDARRKRAQINNPMWTKYPRQMYRSRVVSEGVRTVCPAATSGMFEPEELREFAPEPATIRDVTPVKLEPVRTAKASKAQAALESAREQPADDEIETPETVAVRDLPKDVDEWVDAFEVEIETCAPAECGAKFNAAIRTAEWNTLKEADPERAKSIKSKALERAKAAA